MLEALQYRVLRRIRPTGTSPLTGAAYGTAGGPAKLDILVGDRLGSVRGKVVVDFGCGFGNEAVEIARRGASRVVGVDLNTAALERARILAQQAGVASSVSFTTRAPDESADLILSLDSFEHFADPRAILDEMYRMLVPGGQVVISFGPTWYHPYGGHLFSVFPWGHLLFSEGALLRWRSDHRNDRPRSFEEAGLNRMTIGRFRRLVEQSPFRVEELELVPIRRTRRLHNRLTREFFTSIVRCWLVKP